jgi:hypothetical protein
MWGHVVILYLSTAARRWPSTVTGKAARLPCRGCRGRGRAGEGRARCRGWHGHVALGKLRRAAARDVAPIAGEAAPAVEDVVAAGREAMPVKGRDGRLEGVNSPF